MQKKPQIEFSSRADARAEPVMWAASGGIMNGARQLLPFPSQADPEWWHFAGAAGTQQCLRTIGSDCGCNAREPKLKAPMLGGECDGRRHGSGRQIQLMASAAAIEGPIELLPNLALRIQHLIP
jgi:hypothetical protein